MKACYVDSSVILSVLFREPRANFWLKTLKSYDEFFSCFLLEAEVFAALKRDQRAVEEAYPYFESVSFIYSTRSLLAEYEKIFTAAYCKGADAFHLAAALSINSSPKYLTFLTADKAQAKVAKTLGFKVIL